MGIKFTGDKNGNYKKFKLILSVIKVFILLIIVVGIPAYVVIFHWDWITTLEDFDQMVAILEGYETHAALVYIILQTAQIVVSVLPGQVFQIAVGYLFNPLLAIILALTGAVFGTGISFMLAKFLGRDMVRLFFDDEKISYYMDRLNSKRAYLLVFLIYLVPGIPKDMISYIAGISEMEFKPFLILSIMGRIPGLVGCIAIGNMIYHEIYAAAWIVGAIATVLFILCIIFRKKLMITMDRIYDKLN